MCGLKAAYFVLKSRSIFADDDNDEDLERNLREIPRRLVVRVLLSQKQTRRDSESGFIIGAGTRTEK